MSESIWGDVVTMRVMCQDRTIRDPKKAEEKKRKKLEAEEKEEVSCSRQKSGYIKGKKGTLAKKNRRSGCALRLRRRSDCRGGKVMRKKD